MTNLATIGWAITALSIIFAAMIWAANIVAYNINDIAANGANLGNVFWILFVAVVIVAGGSRGKWQTAKEKN